MTATATGCSVQGCDRTHKAKGMCAMHYRRTGDAGGPDPLRVRDRECLEPWCPTPAVARSLCQRHYDQRRHRGDLPPTIRRTTP